MNKVASKSLLINISVTAAFGIGLSVVLILTGADLVRRVNRIQTQRNELAVSQNAIQSVSRLKIEAEKAASYLNLLEQFLPSRDVALQKAPDQFQKTAKTVGVNLRLATGESAATQNHRSGFTTFNLKITGSYNGLVNFMKNAEAGSLPISWQVIALNRPDSGRDYVATINSRVFHQ